MLLRQGRGGSVKKVFCSTSFSQPVRDGLFKIITLFNSVSLINLSSIKVDLGNDEPELLVTSMLSCPNPYSKVFWCVCTSKDSGKCVSSWPLRGYFEIRFFAMLTQPRRFVELSEIKIFGQPHQSRLQFEIKICSVPSIQLTMFLPFCRSTGVVATTVTLTEFCRM